MDADRCRRLALGDFDVEEVAALAAFAGVELTHRQAARLHDHTRGHPLYVRTLLGELTPAQLRVVEGDLPAPRSLASSVTARLSDLPADAQALAAAMAVINQGSPLPMVGRVAGLAVAGRAVRAAAQHRVRPLGSQPGRARRSSTPIPSTARPSTRTCHPPGAGTCTGPWPAC